MECKVKIMPYNFLIEIFFFDGEFRYNNDNFRGTFKISKQVVSLNTGIF
jgi:hypothetical protein